MWLPALQHVLTDCGVQGTSGNLTVRMAGAVVVRSVSIDHPSRLSSGNFYSAPREFEVYGVDTITGKDR
jgi:hypothetical protein